jgi:hypothetical protein
LRYSPRTDSSRSRRRDQYGNLDVWLKCAGVVPELPPSIGNGQESPKGRLSFAHTLEKKNRGAHSQNGAYAEACKDDEPPALSTSIQ